MQTNRAVQTPGHAQPPFPISPTSHGHCADCRVPLPSRVRPHSSACTMPSAGQGPASPDGLGHKLGVGSVAHGPLSPPKLLSQRPQVLPTHLAATQSPVRARKSGLGRTRGKKKSWGQRSPHITDTKTGVSSQASLLTISPSEPPAAALKTP